MEDLMMNAADAGKLEDAEDEEDEYWGEERRG